MGLINNAEAASIAAYVLQGFRMQGSRMFVCHFFFISVLPRMRDRGSERVRRSLSKLWCLEVLGVCAPFTAVSLLKPLKSAHGRRNLIHSFVVSSSPQVGISSRKQEVCG